MLLKRPRACTTTAMDDDSQANTMKLATNTIQSSSSSVRKRLVDGPKQKRGGLQLIRRSTHSSSSSSSSINDPQRRVIPLLIAIIVGLTLVLNRFQSDVILATMEQSLVRYRQEPFIISAVLVDNNISDIFGTAPIDFPGPEWHPTERSDRFPSVEARIQLYMSNWYQPPCNRKTQIDYTLSRDNETFPTLTYTGPIDDIVLTEYKSIVAPDAKILLEEETMADCGRTPLMEGNEGFNMLEKFPRTEKRIFRRSNLWNYCKDSIEIIAITKQLTRNKYSPILLQMGDEKSLSLSMPVIAKYRGRMPRKELERVSDPSTCADRPHATTAMGKGVGFDGFAPIVWNLNSERHFGMLEQAWREDMPWKDKILGTLWRGFMTGRMDDAEQATELEQCNSNTRCRFVYEANRMKSPLIDAKLIGMYPGYKGGKSCNGVQLVENVTSFAEMQSYKVILSLEGNDVSSALKWNLLSNSVVLMPPPTKTSWAMEELLEPWVHYIPVHANLSNLEEQIRWVGNNDDFARRIAERATLFMYDLWISPEAQLENLQVKYGILDRYRNLWRP